MVGKAANRKKLNMLFDHLGDNSVWLGQVIQSRD